MANIKKINDEDLNNVAGGLEFPLPIPLMTNIMKNQKNRVSKIDCHHLLR